MSGGKVVAVIARLSPRPDGKYEGVDLQEKWGREYAAERWPGMPVEVFADPGISASNGDYRPELERFLFEWLEEGRVAHVWAVEQSRLSREVDGKYPWFSIAAKMDAAGIDELHTNRDGIVRVHDDVAGIKAVLANGEIRKMKRRINDRLAEIAAAGEPPGSRPYGYVHAVNAEGRRTYAIVPDQAEAIRFAADKVLAGWSLSNIAVDLRARGFHGAHEVTLTTTGKRYYRRNPGKPNEEEPNGPLALDEHGQPIKRPGALTASAVKQMVTNPTVAGQRVHRGKIIGQGNWPAILDETTWQQVCSKLGADRVVRRKGGGTYPISERHRGNPTGRKYLLTGGLATCGICDAPLVGSVKRMKNARQHPYLLCHPNRGGKGCIGMMLPETEEHVANQLFDKLDSPEFLDAVAADEHEARRAEIVTVLGALVEKRKKLAAQWAVDALTDAEWNEAREAIDEREEELRTELNSIPPPPARADIAGAREAWAKMELDEQRALLRRFIDRVVIVRAKPGTKGFDPERVKIEWRKA